MKKWVILGLLALLIWLSAASFFRVEPPTREKLKALKQNLKLKGFQAQMVIPLHGKRSKIENRLASYFFGASPKSQHLHGQAIDLLILDVNNDGKSDQTDVQIVRRILDLVIVNNHGGLGHCLDVNHPWSDQIIHFDNRGYRARWYDQSVVSGP